MNANLPAAQRTVTDLVAEYDDKCADIQTAISDFNAAYDRLQMASTVQGTFVENVGSRSYLHAESIQKNLCKSGWMAIYRRLEIERIASAKDKQLFERTMASPPALTFENAKATFGDYLMRPRFHILRGLAEVFADLDPAYKSHSKVKVGVKGLPKRVIIAAWGEYSSSYGRDKFTNVANALAAYQGIEHFEFKEMSAINAMHDRGDDAVLDGQVVSVTDRYGKVSEFPTVKRGLTVRRFANGNAHLIFSPESLLDVNRALAEFYGDVLPDAEPEGVKPSASTAVSKDLQFYGSPRAVAEAAADFADIHSRECYSRGNMSECRVLEPSCGDGRILDVLRDRNCLSLGIEYHPGRAAEARGKGHAVITANFLEQAPTADFDRVVMNPPFYGRHYVKHVQHAVKFLKTGGTLVAILPATACYDHGELKGEWRDLPVASFAESGTNVPTCLFRIVKREA